MNLLYPITTLSFAYPLAFGIPPALFFLWLTRGRSNVRPVLYPDTKILSNVKPTLRMWLRAPILGGLASLFVVCLSLAAARPQRVSLIHQPYSSRNLMVALDVSRSMGAADYRRGSERLSRLEAVKYVVAEFIRERVQDRLGLVVFGSTAYLQAPLTRDHSLIESMVERLEVGMAGDGTAIGDGLGVSLKRIEDIEGESKAIILVTDGVSNSGEVNPIQAAKVARDLGIKVHTIGIGSEEAVAIQVPAGPFADNFIKRVEYDEKTLKSIAEITGGVYFNAHNLKDLERVYTEINKLERTEDEEPAKRQVEELFPQYAFIALISFGAYIFLARSVFRKIPC